MITESTSVELTNLENSISPKFDGAKLALKRAEISRSVTWSQEPARFVLGADWSLRLFDREGKQSGRATCPARYGQGTSRRTAN